MTAKFVQFMHPGYEHRPDEPGWKGWNTGDHRRKFLRSRGRYRFDINQSDQRGDLTFWGEWEAQSRATVLPRSDAGPRWLHTPLLQPMPSYRGAQNTDPFVFGDRFLYTCCKQRLRSGRPTQLRFLPPGSVILFGSHVAGGFGLDTVFVVDDHLDHATPSDVLNDVPAEYVHTTLRPVYEMDDDYCDPNYVGWRLYRGATADRSPSPFSFVPARPVDSGGPEGFPRVIVTLQGLITPSLRQGQKITVLAEGDLDAVWRSIVDQVLAHDLVLATAFDMPPVETTTAAPQGGRSRC